MKNLLPFFFFTIICFSCTPVESIENQPVQGMKPIYSENDEWQNIQVTEARSIKKLGKIYYKDGFIFVNESAEGIHIIDNSDPTNPVFLKFIEIIGNRDIAIKGDILYADNITDLVTLDISDFNDIKVLDRVKDIYPSSIQTYPDGYFGPFECVIPTKGYVIGWEEASLVDPDCWR